MGTFEIPTQQDQFPTEQRQFPRTPLNSSVSFLWGGKTISGFGHNFSGNGILFSFQGEQNWVGRALERGLIPGASLRLFFTVCSSSGEKRSMNVVGTIVRLNKDENGRTELALCFT